MWEMKWLNFRAENGSISGRNIQFGQKPRGTSCDLLDKVCRHNIYHLRDY